MVTCTKLGRYGRLGNQMFQIAAVIGIATQNGHEYAFPYWKNYDHLERFGSTEDIDIQSYFKNPLPLLIDQTNLQHKFVHWGYHKTLLRRGNWDLEGHFQSEKYFKNVEDKVRYYFRLKNEYKQSNCCAIHVRLGDYDDKYHPRLKMDYYNEAMSHFPENTWFMVFSDDPKAAAEMFGGRASVRVGQHYMDDFAMMKSCKDFIIGNSTFSWWAAWLGEHPEKKVVAPKKWFGVVDGQPYLFSDDIYCENWIVI